MEWKVKVGGGVGDVKREWSAHLVLDILEADRKVNGEDDQDNVAFWVAQRPQSIVLLLSCRVPERDLDNLAVKLSVCYVVLEHGGYVRLRRCVDEPWMANERVLPREARYGYLGRRTSGNLLCAYTINRHVFPQPPCNNA